MRGPSVPRSPYARPPVKVGGDLSSEVLYQQARFRLTYRTKAGVGVLLAPRLVFRGTVRALRIPAPVDVPTVTLPSGATVRADDIAVVRRNGIQTGVRTTPRGDARIVRHELRTAANAASRDAGVPASTVLAVIRSLSRT